MKNLLVIIKKELHRVFKDFKLLFTTVFMPGLMIFLLYSILGNVATFDSNKAVVEADIAICNGSDTFKSYLLDDELENSFKVTFIDIQSDEIETRKQELKEEKIDYIIYFEEDFENKVLNKEIPQVLTYYNPSNDDSSYSNEIITTLLGALEKQYKEIVYGDTNVFVSNMGSQDSLVFEEKKMMGKTLSTLFPFLIVTFLFSGAMSIGPESIAGEKERGTMATLLVTPTKRSHIALGKVISLGIIASLSAISSFIGILFSLPNMMGIDSNLMNIYGVGEYIVLLATLLSTVLVIISLISIISCYAKNVKEASLYVVPIYLISMIVGMTSMMDIANSLNDFLFLIPIFNSVQILTELFSFSFSINHFILMLVSNSVITFALVFLLTKMFDNEKIMFSK